MERIRQREIVIVPFPHSDGKATKVRPALVISGDAFNSAGQDIVICAMTTAQTRSEPGFVLDNTLLSEGSLITPGFVRIGALHRIHKARILRSIARAKPSVQALVEQELLALIRK